MSQTHLSRSTLLSCSLADDVVFMRLPDGSTFVVDKNTVERSEALAEYLSSAEGNEFTIPVSEDMFHAWLSLVDVLERGDEIVQHRLFSMSDEEVLLYLQVRYTNRLRRNIHVLEFYLQLSYR